MVQNYINFVISNLDVAPDKVQVAAGTFSDNAAVAFRFNEYRSVPPPPHVYRYCTGHRGLLCGRLEVPFSIESKQ